MKTYDAFFKTTQKNLVAVQSSLTFLETLGFEVTDDMIRNELTAHGLYTIRNYNTLRYRFHNTV